MQGRNITFQSTVAAAEAYGGDILTESAKQIMRREIDVSVISNDSALP